MSAGTKLIFQGVKFYWRTRNTIDVTMVEHIGQDLTEVVLYDPSIGKEAPRIYLRSSALFTKLDPDDIELQLSFAKRNSVPITDKFMDGIVNKSLSEYILNRLVISEYSVEKKVVMVNFQINGLDRDTASPLCEKPISFVSFKTLHYQQLLAGVVDHAIQELDAEKVKLHIECDKAQELEHIAEVSTRKLSHRERWRIPIVFVKISNSKRLAATDAKIWSSVSQNMRTEEDANRMAAVLTRNNVKRISSASLAPTAAPSRSVSFSGNHETQHVPVYHHVVSPSTTPRHYRGPAQSKLHQATAATRHRTEATVGSHSRESSVHRSDAAAHASVDGHSSTAKATTKEYAGETSYNSKRRPSKEDSGESSYNRRKRATKDEDGETSYNRRERATKDESGESSYNKRPAGSKAPKSPRRPVSRNNSTSKTANKPLLNRLRRSLLGTSPDTDAVDDANGTMAGADDAQSALQRMIAGLGVINNSLRASFLSGLSGKSGNTASSAKTSLVAHAGGRADERPTTADNTPFEGAAAMCVDAYAPVTQKPQRSFFGAFGGASSTATTASGATTSDATAATMPGAAQKYVTNGGTSTAAAAASEFTIHRFFSGLVHWRSGNKIYVDEVA